MGLRTFATLIFCHKLIYDEKNSYICTLYTLII